MMVLHLSTYHFQGGAARAAHRLHRGLLRQGHESLMFVAVKGSEDPAVTAYEPARDLCSRLRRSLRRKQITRSLDRYLLSRPDGYELFSDYRSEYGSDLPYQLPDCDVINVHWIAGLVDYGTFFDRVSAQIPIVWTLHDMNPFTGGCHYDLGCGRYSEGCGVCPQLGSIDPGDLSHRIWKHKQRIFERIEPSRLHIVSPSHWLAGESSHSALMGKYPVSIIPHGLEIDDFARRDRSVARDTLKVPEDAKVVLFAANEVGVRRKGFDLLAQALSRLESISRLLLVSLGEGRPALNTQVPHLHLGYIDNDRFLSLVYSAADVLIIPSTQEAFGQTALEAMACGIPIVGFAVGGIPDIVRPGITGLLAPLEDVRALAAAIEELVNNDAKREEMSSNCRRIAIQEYALEVQANRYVELYEKMLVQS
jgi:glycosyltransferase involved in cell wall biosynthesis